MELYSKRKMAAENPPTQYRYDLPTEFRNQVIFVWAQSVGYRETAIPRRPVAPYDLENMAILQVNQFFNRILNAFCEAHYLLSLPDSGQFDGPCVALRAYFQKCSDDDALDIIELTFQEMFTAQEDLNFGAYIQPALKASEAIEKLNQRFQEHAIGFRLEQGRIVRLDSEFLHSETTEQALTLMHSKSYEGALEEFQLALKYYRQGPSHYDDCLTNCLKAVESTLQKIIESHSWEIPGKAKFDNLLTEVKKKGLFPPFLGGHLGELEKFLQAVAVIRNEEGGHGSGSLPNEIPDHLIAYQIHLTGSAIVFLVRSSEEFKKRMP
jgi:AbiJ N-terminal domain 4